MPEFHDTDEIDFPSQRKVTGETHANQTPTYPLFNLKKI